MHVGVRSPRVTQRTLSGRSRAAAALSHQPPQQPELSVPSVPGLVAACTAAAAAAAAAASAASASARKPPTMMPGPAGKALGGTAGRQQPRHDVAFGMEEDDTEFMPKDSTPLLSGGAGGDAYVSVWASPGGDGGGMAGGGAPSDPRMPQSLESLDYEPYDNTVARADNASRTAWSKIKYNALKWGACFTLAVCTAAAAFLVNLSVENISGAKFGLTLSVMDKSGVLPSFLIYTLFNALLVLAAVSITVFVGPSAAGSGIPEVKAFLNGVDVPGIFFLNTLVAKVGGAIGSVAGGLAIGKEGPFVHAGAGIAAIISQGGPPGAEWPVFRRLWNDRDRSDMVACGAAAGVAAAFRSPVGGVLFVLEEMTSWWKEQLLWQMFFTTAVVSVTVRVLMNTCGNEGCGFFGSGGFIIFEIQEGQANYEFYELVPVLLLGVIGGLLGSSFITINAKLSEWRRRLWAQHGARGKVVEALVVSLLTSVVSFMLPLMVECQACPPDTAMCPRVDNSHSGNFVSFFCSSDTQYNDLATIFFNTQDDAIRNLFSSKTKQEYTIASLVTFVTCFYFLSVITYGIACPTGLFVPSILCGAAYGRLVGMFVADIQRHQHIDEGTYALLGAASFLGGSTRLTMSTCVMLLELTNNLALLPLTMLVLLVAKAVGDGTGVKPIYEVLMEMKGLMFLPPQPEGFMRHVSARECAGRPPQTLRQVERVSVLLGALRRCRHSAFPVVVVEGGGRTGGRGAGDGAGGAARTVGLVLRQQLLHLLDTKRALQRSSEPSPDAGRIATTYHESDFSKPMSMPGLDVCDLQLDEADLDMYIDLGPYANPSYFVVQEDTPLSKVYTLFRTLGLRHLCVVPRADAVVGVITRKDLLPEYVEARFLSALGGQYNIDGDSLQGRGPSAGAATAAAAAAGTDRARASGSENGGGGGAGCSSAGAGWTSASGGAGRRVVSGLQHAGSGNGEQLCGVGAGGSVGGAVAGSKYRTVEMT